MSTITQNDLLVRLQLGGCCAADKLSKIVDQLLYGGCCLEELFHEASQLLMYLEILECYKFPTPETRATASLDTTAWTLTGSGSFTLQFFTNDSFSVTLSGQTNIDTALTSIMNTINSGISGYNATYISKIFKVIAPKGRGKIPNGTLQFLFGASGSIFVNITPTNIATFNGGIDGQTLDDVHNCITDDKIINIFERIGQICNICFEPLGFTYNTNNTTNTGVDILTEVSDVLNTEVSDDITTES